jgi:Spy/CpxP family protein refolding chaperone
MMKQPLNKFLIIAIGILLVANIVLLSLFVLNKSGNGRPERRNPMNTYLKNEIGFSDSQMVQLDTIRNQHRRESKSIYDAVRLRKEENLRQLGQRNFSDSSILAAAAYSAEVQKELEVTMLRHIRDIRSICTESQRAKFDTGFYKIMQRPHNPDDKKVSQ